MSDSPDEGEDTHMSSPSVTSTVVVTDASPEAGDDLEEGELATSAAGAKEPVSLRISPAQYRQQKKAPALPLELKPPPSDDEEYVEPHSQPDPYDVQAQPKDGSGTYQHVDIRDTAFAEYDIVPHGKSRRDSEPRPPVHIFSDRELHDFGLGAPMTIVQALERREISSATFRKWLRQSNRHHFVGLPVIADIGQDPADFERQFFDWVERTKHADMDHVRRPATVGDVRKLRDMRLRFARLFITPGAVAEGLRVSTLSMPTPADDPTSGTSRSGGSAIGTTRGDPARTGEQDRRSRAGAAAQGPTSSGYAGSQATSRGAPTRPHASERPRGPRHGSGPPHGDPEPGAGRVLVASPSAGAYAAPGSHLEEKLSATERRLAEVEQTWDAGRPFVRSNWEDLQHVQATLRQVEPIVSELRDANADLRCRMTDLEAENRGLWGRVLDLERVRSREYGRPRRSRSRSPPPRASRQGPMWSPSSQRGSREQLDDSPRQRYFSDSPGH